MSYAEEKRRKDAEKAKRSQRYRYEPDALDIIDARTILKRGDIVVKVQPHGCPENGTMGQCYVGHPETGEFIGMVSIHSLVPIKEPS